MKVITIFGGIGKDAQTRQAGDQRVTSFSVAVDEGFGDKKRTIWFGCDLWGNRGEKLAQYLTKGSRVCVTGELSTRENDGRTYLTIRAADVTLAGGGQRGDRAPINDRAMQAPASQGSPLDDEIPFAPEVR